VGSSGRERHGNSGRRTGKGRPAYHTMTDHGAARVGPETGLGRVFPGRGLPSHPPRPPL